ncbi:MAG: hypothetical protein CMJ78_17860 [Planctomycetaceae bacterium]|nr:hypothetical protein [Planctomycetaceae bacterium]
MLHVTYDLRVYVDGLRLGPIGVGIAPKGVLVNFCRVTKFAVIEAAKRVSLCCNNKSNQWKCGGKSEWRERKGRDQ